MKAGQQDRMHSPVPGVIYVLAFLLILLEGAKKPLQLASEFRSLVGKVLSSLGR